MRVVAQAEAATSTKKAAKKAATKTTTKTAKKTTSAAVKKTTKKAAKKTTKKAAKKTTRKKAAKKATKRTSRAKAPIRRKIIWAVGKPGLNPVSTYAYKDRSYADKEALKLGEGFMVMAARVPMEDDPVDEAGEEE